MYHQTIDSAKIKLVVFFS